MSVNLKILKDFLESLESLNFSRPEEYQDKFYLKKQIQEKFPELSDRMIYAAIDSANKKIKESQVVKKYTDLLSNEILTSFNIFVQEKY